MAGEDDEKEGGREREWIHNHKIHNHGGIE